MWIMILSNPWLWEMDSSPLFDYYVYENKTKNNMTLRYYNGTILLYFLTTGCSSTTSSLHHHQHCSMSFTTPPPYSHRCYNHHRHTTNYYHNHHYRRNSWKYETLRKWSKPKNTNREEHSSKELKWKGQIFYLVS